MKKYISFILVGCLIIGFPFLITEKAFSQTTSDGTSQVVTGITAGRAKSLITAAVGLISLVTGWRAKARAAREAVGARAWSVTALLLGLICTVLSVLHLVTTTGGFGTGGGKAGAIVALVLGMTGMALGAMALRTKRAYNGNRS